MAWQNRVQATPSLEETTKEEMGKRWRDRLLLGKQEWNNELIGTG
jgi:hypothetical protein